MDVSSPSTLFAWVPPPASSLQRKLTCGSRSLSTPSLLTLLFGEHSPPDFGSKEKSPPIGQAKSGREYVEGTPLAR